MKIFHLLIIAGGLATPLHALDSETILAVAGKFETSTPDAQYQDRLALYELIDDATIPGKSDPAALTRTLVLVLQGKSVPPEAAKYILRAMTRVATPDAVPYLAELLGGQDSLFREEARQVLESIHDSKSVAVLESALGKETNKVGKLGLINSLAVQKSASSVSFIAPFIMDSDLEVAKAAVLALARIGGDQAVEMLKKANASSKVVPVIKPDIEESLLIASSDSGPVALEVFQTTESDIVRLAAFIALTKGTPDDSVTSTIEKSLKSENPELRQAALRRGLELNLPSLQSTLAQGIDQMPEDDRMVVLANLQSLKPAELAEKIALARLSSTLQGERVAAILALGKIGGKPAFDAVLTAVGDKTPPVSQAAASALANMDFPAAEASLLGMLKSDSTEDKILAVKAVVFRQVAGANDVLIEIIAGNDAAASKEAMKSLYFTATLEDLQKLCIKAAATQDAARRKSLVSISSKIATRIDTDEARELVKTLQ